MQMYFTYVLSANKQTRFIYFLHYNCWILSDDSFNTTVKLVTFKNIVFKELKSKFLLFCLQSLCQYTTSATS